MRIGSRVQQDAIASSGGMAAILWAGDEGSVPDQANASIEGGAPLPVLDSVTAQRGTEGTHVDGALAAHAAAMPAAGMPETVSLAASPVRQFAMVFPSGPETLSGAGAVIRMLGTGENAATLDSLEVGVATAPSPRGFLDAAWLAVRVRDLDAPPPAMEASLVAWTDAASVEGAAVLAIGGATLVLSNWPATV